MQTLEAILDFQFLGAHTSITVTRTIKCQFYTLTVTIL
jgi:hypothetical protein